MTIVGSGLCFSNLMLFPIINNSYNVSVWTYYRLLATCSFKFVTHWPNMFSLICVSPCKTSSYVIIVVVCVFLFTNAFICYFFFLQSIYFYVLLNNLR